MDAIGQIISTAVSGLLGSILSGIFQVILKVFDILFFPFIRSYNCIISGNVDFFIANAFIF